MAVKWPLTTLDCRSIVPFQAVMHIEGFLILVYGVLAFFDLLWVVMYGVLTPRVIQYVTRLTRPCFGRKVWRRWQDRIERYSSAKYTLRLRLLITCAQSWRVWQNFLSIQKKWVLFNSHRVRQRSCVGLLDFVLVRVVPIHKIFIRHRCIFRIACNRYREVKKIRSRMKSSIRYLSFGLCIGRVIGVVLENPVVRITVCCGICL